jgi:hypothetical protein
MATGLEGYVALVESALSEIIRREISWDGSDMQEHKHMLVLL